MPKDVLITPASAQIEIKDSDGVVFSKFTDTALGIGTATPSQLLHVDGDAKIDHLLGSKLVNNLQSDASLHFDGDNDVVSVTHNDNLDVGENMSISAMIELSKLPTAASRSFAIVSKFYQYELVVHSADNKLQIGIPNIAGGPRDTTALEVGRSYHVVATWDRVGNGVKYYINGVLSSSSAFTTSPNFTSNASFTIGANASSGEEFDGQISQVRIHNRALSAQEVKEAYNGQRVPYQYVGANQTLENVSTFINAAAYAYPTFSGASATGFTAASNETATNIVSTADEISLVPGKSYRVKFDFDYVSGEVPTLRLSKSVTGADLVRIYGTAWGSILAAEDATKIYEFTYDTSFSNDIVEVEAGNAVLKFQNSTNTSYAISNLSIIQIGCVAEYLPSGITQNDVDTETGGVWYDSSGNGLNGVATGAIPTNYGLQALTINAILPAAGDNLLAVKNGNGTKFVVSEDGSVGIGIDSPTRKLEVYDSTANSINLTLARDTNDKMHFYPNYTGFGVIQSASVTGLLLDGTGATSNNQLFLKSDGYVGIGTDAPSKPLHVKSDSNAPINVESTDATTGIRFTDSNGLGTIYYNGTNNYFNTTSKLEVGTGPSSTLRPTVHIGDTTNGASVTLRGKSPVLYFDITSSGQGTILTDGAGLAIKDGTLDSQGNIDFIIDSSGKVGIGTAAPEEKFEVHGTSGQLFQVSDDLDDVVFSANNISGLPVIEAKSDNTVILGKFGRNDLVVDSDGKVGVGTDSPDYLLDVEASSGYAYSRTVATADGQRALGIYQGKNSSGTVVDLRLGSVADAGQGQIYTFTNHDLGFSTNNAVPQMILKTSGNVGIGNSPNSVSKLEVDGQVRSSTLIVGDSGLGNVATNSQLHIKNSTAAVIRLEDSDASNYIYDIKADESTGFLISDATPTVGAGDVLSIEKLTGTLDQKANRIVNSQTVNDLQSGASFWFDDIDDTIILPAGSNYFGTGDFSQEFWIKGLVTQSGILFSTMVTGASPEIFVEIEVNPNGYFYAHLRDADDNTISDNLSGGYPGTNIGDGNWHHLVFTWQRNGNVAWYLNGVVQGSTGIAAMEDSDLGGSNAVHLMQRSNGLGELAGELSKVVFHNRLLIEDEVKAAYNGQSVSFEHRGASQTELVTGVDNNWGTAQADTGNDTTDRATFNTNYTWGHNGSPTDISVASNVLTYTSSNADWGIYWPNLLEQGKSYRMTINVSSISSGATLKVSGHDGSAYDDYATLSVGSNTFEFIHRYSNLNIHIRGLGTYSLNASSVITSMVKIGCVAEYLPSGITQNDVSVNTGSVWYDSSGNGLDGVATGATPTNHGLQALTINADGPAAGSNLLAIKNADTTKFVVDEAGNVGIGTDAPASKLSIEYSETNGVTPSIEIYSNANNSEDHIIKMGRPATSIPVGMGWDNSTNQFVIARNVSGNLSTGKQFVIKPQGEVGIGTDNPGAGLHIDTNQVGANATDNYQLLIDGDFNIPTSGHGMHTSAGIQVNDATESGSGFIYNKRGITIAEQTSGNFNVNLMIGTIGDYNVPAQSYSLFSGSARQSYFSGTLGLGTLWARTKLHVTQAADTSYPTLGTNQGALFISGDTNLYGQYFGINTSSGAAWSQVMRNDSATAYNMVLQPVGGNVGIGETTPTSKLHVAGDIDNSANRIVNSQTVNDLQSDASFSFVNTTDIITVGDDPNLDVGTSDYSWEAWIKTEATHHGTVLIKDISTGPMLFIHSDGRVRWTLYHSGNIDTYSVGTVDDGNWHHILGVVDRDSTTGINIYIDGVLDGTGNPTSKNGVDLSTSSDLRIGKHPSVTSETFEGQMSQVRLHNRALSADEVKAAYNGQSVPFEYVGANQTELTTNGTMEGGANPPTGWLQDGTATVTSDTDEYSGTYSCKVVTSTGHGIAQFYRSCVAGKWYEFSGWIKTTVGSGAYAYLYDGAVYTTQTLTGSSWQRFSMPFKCQVTDNVNLRVWGNSGTGTTFYVDDVSLNQIGCVAEYLPSGITQNDVDTATGGVWYDSSGNGLDGVATGATPTNFGLQALTINADGPAAGSNLLAIKNADTTKFVVDEAGQVGIGTDSPNQIFHVKNTGAHTTFRLENDNADFLIQSGNAGDDGLHFYDNANSEYRMTIDNAGQVGIGTTTPAYKLDVIGTGDASGQHRIRVRSSSTATTAGSILHLSSPNGEGYLIKNNTTMNSMGNKSLYLWNSDGPIEFVPSATIANRVTIDTSGNVGIGTVSPDAKLHVDYYGTDLNFVKLLGDESAGSHGFITSQAKDFSSAIALNAIYTTHGTGQTLRNNKLLQIHSNETGTTGSGLYVTHGGDISSPTHVAIATNYLGNVGIGTAAPTSRLHVAGDIDNSANRIVNSQTVNDLQSDASWVFDGATSKIKGTANAALNMAGSSGMTISGWFKAGPTAGTGTPYCFGWFADSSNSILVKCPSSANVSVRTEFNGNAGGFDVTEAPSDTEWHHFVVTVTGTTYNSYYDGVFVATDTGNDLDDCQSVNGYLNCGESGGSYYEGSISQVRIHNRALSADEVKASYNGQSVPYQYRGANQTGIMTGDSVDGDGGTIGDWITWYNSGAITNTSNNLQFNFPDSSGTSAGIAVRLPTISNGNKRYGLSITIDSVSSGSGTVMNTTLNETDAGYTQSTFNTFAASVGTHFIETTLPSSGQGFTIGENLDLKISQTHAAGTVTFVVSNIQLYQIGCVAEYLPSGITQNDVDTATGGVWYDSSGNGLDGVATGATPTNFGLQALTINADGPAAGSNLLAIKNADTTKFNVTEAGQVVINGNPNSRPAENQLIIYSNDTSVNNQLVIEQDGAGDASLAFLRSALQGWQMGIDASLSNSFVIGSSWTDLDGYPRLVIDTDGKVGIGTDDPGSGLDVQEIRTTAYDASNYTTWSGIHVHNTTNNTGVATGISFSNDGSIYTNGSAGIAAIAEAGDSEQSLVFITRPYNVVSTERMRITSDGTQDHWANRIVNSQTVNDLQSDASFHFDGSGTVSLDMNYTGGTGWSFDVTNLTMTMWVKSTMGDNDYTYLWDIYTTVSPNERIIYAWQGSTAGKLGFFHDDGPGNGAWHLFGDTPSDGQWHHLAFVTSGTTVTCYLDGVQSGSSSTVPAVAPIFTATHVHMGSYLTGSGSNFDGQISQARFHNRVLSAEEVKAAYNGQSVSYEYRGASQTQLIADNFSTYGTDDNSVGINGWSVSGGGIYTISRNSSGYMQCVAASSGSVSNSAHFYLNSPSSENPIVGKRYKVEIEVWSDDTGIGIATASGTSVVPGTASHNSPNSSYIFQGAPASSSGTVYSAVLEVNSNSGNGPYIYINGQSLNTTVYIDNVKLTRVGCVAEYLPSGITKNDTDGVGGIWYDSSGNGLDGTTTTATPTNFGLQALTINADGPGSGSNLLAIKNADTIKFAVDEAGRVGIGTDASGASLHVKKTSNDALLKIETTTAGAYQEIISATNGWAGLQLNHGSTGKWWIGQFGVTNRLQIGIGSRSSHTEAISILTTGNVGIGTADPKSTLSVYEGDENQDDAGSQPLPASTITILNGDGRADLSFVSQIEGSGTTTQNVARIEAEGGSGWVSKLHFYTAGNWNDPALKIMTLASANSSSKHVGIGTEVPDAPLEIVAPISDPIAMFSYNESNFQGEVYIAGTQINAGYGHNAERNLFLNYYGYLKGTTQFRNTIIGDGKSNEVFRIEGSTGDIDQKANRIVNSQTVSDLQSDASFHFDGTATTQIAPPNSTHLNPGYGDYSAHFRFKVDSFPGNTWNMLYSNRYDGSNNIQFSIHDTGYLRLYASKGSAAIEGNTGAGVIQAGEWYDVVYVVDRDTSNYIYVNGVAQTLSPNTYDSGANDLSYDSVSSIGAYQQGLYNNIDGQISNFRFHNRALSADEVKAAYNGQRVPYQYLGASQTNLLDNSDFEGPTAGANPPTGWGNEANGTATSVTGSDARSGTYGMKVVSSTVHNGAYNHTYGLTIGKNYRVSGWVKTTDNIYILVHNGAGWTQQSFGTGTGSWQYFSLGWKQTVSTSSQLYLRSSTDGSTTYWDDLSVTQVGCVAEYLPSGITQNDVVTETGGVWYDSSGNGLDGVATGATPTNFGLQALTINADGPAAGSNLLAIKNAGVLKFVVDENGQLGIGCAPSVDLDILSDVGYQDGGLSIRHSNNTAGISIGYGGLKMIGTATDGDLKIDSKGAGHLVLNSTATGNVGIGTDTPTHGLHVVVGQSTNGAILLHQNVATNNPTVVIDQNVFGGNGNMDIGLKAQIYGVNVSSINTDRILHLKGRKPSDSSQVSRFMVLRDGRTIIGDNIAATSVAANSRFEVHGTSGQLFQVSDDLDDVVFSANNISGLPVIEAKADNTVTLGKFGRNDLVVESSGEVGIGFESPAKSLEVSGTVRATHTQGSKYIDLSHDGTNSHLGSTGASSLYLDSTGNIYLNSASLILVNKTLRSDTDNRDDLGSSSQRWANLYVADLQLSNENTGGNEVDGTEGSWSVQEGEDDIYLINRKNGKRFKIKLEEVE